MKQTAVDWLVDQVEDFIGLIPTDIIEKAKEMEKQQIIETARFYFHGRGNATPEQYYNQEYGGEE